MIEFKNFFLDLGPAFVPAVEEPYSFKFPLSNQSQVLRTYDPENGSIAFESFKLKFILGRDKKFFSPDLLN
ncbi:hypothetical protein D0X99_16605 [Algoriphagus lacus]|uniref:Uncharacterized protein n=1 Tax=Algoriphagus lacus TaxID=2056311 RepID=A0A418PNR3_9BACT|nr:hypothetical protein D0X99_16605 [Algoriphagus lacus]